MPTILRTGGGGDTLFPAGYEWKSTALGDVFPGWSADIIPICINVSKGTSYSIDYASGSRNMGSKTSSSSINGKTSAYASTSFATYSTAGGSVSGTVTANSYSVFLPYFYNFDFDAIKQNIKSGTCTVWLEKK